jgi:hypothetical protein
MTRQNKILILAVALLIIINIAMLVMMLSQRKGTVVVIKVMAILQK